MTTTLATPSRLSQRERKRRGIQGTGSRSVPVPLLAPALISVAFLVLPLAGLIVRAPWGSLWSILQSSDASQALRLSLWTSTVATGVSLVIGVPLAWVLARTDFPGLRFLRALVTLPLVLPPVVGGVALLLALGATVLSAGTSTNGSASRSRSARPRSSWLRRSWPCHS